MAGAALWTCPSCFPWQARRFRRVVVARFFFANRIVTAASSGDNVHIAWQAWDIVRVSFCLAGVVFRADPSCVESHLARQAQYLGHFGTLYTFTPHTLHFTLHTLHLPLPTLHFTLLTLHFTLCAEHPTLNNYFTLISSYICVGTTPYTLHSPLYSSHTP